MHRLCVTRLAYWHFAPTRQAADNLLREGVDPGSILVCGNTVVDAMLQMQTRIAQRPPHMPERIRKIIRKPFVLVTGHRRESFGSGLESVCRGLLVMLERHTHLHLIYPLHPNPNASEPVLALLGNHPRAHLIRPQPYEVLLSLLQHCRLVVTDSGGIQEEAPTFHKRVVVTRETTERPEGVRTGWSVLVGTNPERLVEVTSRLLGEHDHTKAAECPNPYGDGHAGERIASFILRSLDGRQ